jgi:hypothetical protein
VDPVPTPKRKPHARPRPAPKILAGDLELLEFLARQRLAVDPQVVVVLDTPETAARSHLERLEAEGLVCTTAVFEGHPAAHRITTKGLAAIGSELRAPRLDLATYRHDVGLTWLWLAARDGTFGALSSLVSEREMRSHDARPERAGEPFGVGLGGVGPGGREQLHYPDLLLRTAAGNCVAIELELTHKSRHRLERIMLAYAGDRRIDAVLYLVPARERALATRIQQAARRAGIDRIAHVQTLAGQPVGAPDHGRTLGRRGSRTPVAEAER